MQQQQKKSHVSGPTYSIICVHSLEISISNDIATKWHAWVYSWQHDIKL